MAAKVYQFSAPEATRESILLRAAICGPTGSGKTKTAMIIGSRMVERLKLGPMFVIDAESKSALRYAPNRTGGGYRFRHCPMPEDDYSPAAYTAALDYCEAQGAGVIIIDSFSHAWNGINGVLEQVDATTAASRTRNTFSEGWKAMTPIHNRLVQRVLSSGCHVIFTLRSKVEWVMQQNERGKTEPVKIGLAPIQREGLDYEPDLFFDMTVPDNSIIVSKSRCDKLAMGERIARPGPEFADIIVDWIQDSDIPGAARTLGEAIAVAVREGIVAADERAPEKYKEAKKKLLEWCAAKGIESARAQVAAEQFKERVASVAGPKQATPDPGALEPLP